VPLWSKEAGQNYAAGLEKGGADVPAADADACVCVGVVGCVISKLKGRRGGQLMMTIGILKQKANLPHVSNQHLPYNTEELKDNKL